MTFEEFFKKKKINLTALQTAEGPLFAEFKEHYEAMGEKSFDHTKKYWFNKLRRAYPLPPEVKAQKVVIENKMAEQTIADTLTDPATIPAVAPKPGFTPRFGAGAKPPEGSLAQNAPAEETPPPPAPEQQQTVENPAETPAAKPAGFKPRFKAGVTSAKPAEETGSANETAPAEQSSQEKPVEANASKPAGFKPRFKAGVTTSKPAEEQAPSAEEPTGQQPSSGQQATETTGPATSRPSGFKPRFKAGVTATKPAGEETKPAPAEEPATAPENAEPQSPQTTEPPASKPTGFKPRFKAGVTKNQTSDIPPGQLDINESATVTPEVNEAAAVQAEKLEQNPDADINQVKPEFQQEKEAAQEAYGSIERVPEKQSPQEFIDDKKAFTDEKQPENAPIPPAKLGFIPRFKPKE